jgi:hypothetical protein
MLLPFLFGTGMGGGQSGTAYAAPRIVASGTTFAQLRAGGVSGHLERLIAAQAATADPTTAATVAATGGGSSGGSLGAGTYYLVFTETNGIGETKISPESSQLTLSSGNIPRVTFPAMKGGNTARQLYVGAVNGSSGGPYTLYAVGITTATFDMAAAVPSNSFAVNPPTVNSTGLTYTITGGTQNKTLELVRSAKNGRLDDVYRFLRQAIEEFISGKPVSFSGLQLKLRHAQTAVAMLNVLCTEMGTLISANAGTPGNSADAIGIQERKRTWP